MNPLDPCELSAFLDGELPPARAREIAQHLASDPLAKAAYDALADSDARWRAAGRSAIFSPSLTLRPTKTASLIESSAVIFLVLLLSAQTLLRSIEALAPMLFLNILALVVVLGGVIFMVTQSSTSEPVAVL